MILTVLAGESSQSIPLESIAIGLDEVVVEIRKCEYERCRRNFVPSAQHQRFCGPRCKERAFRKAAKVTPCPA